MARGWQWQGPGRYWRRLASTCVLLLAVLSWAGAELGTLIANSVGLPQPFNMSTANTVHGARPVDPNTILPPSSHDSLSDAVGSYVFLSHVGGVAFDGVAAGTGGLQVVGLSYLKERPDGQRLQVRLRNRDGEVREFTAPIHDWQLKPIALFADSGQFECFTLFGQLANVDEAQLRPILAEGGRFMQYHPAFLDSLMGMRLMQADILILVGDACDLPRVDGAYVLGKGESAPDVQANLEQLMALQRYQQGLPGGPFQSYVICDVGQTITYGVRGGQLVLTGDPYWYCWKSKTSDPAANAAAQKEANRIANLRLQTEFQRDQQTLPRAAFNAKYTRDYQVRRHHELWDEYMSSSMLQPLPEYSAALSARIKELHGITPPVYTALQTTMRYAGLFRAAKAAAPENYRSFMQSLNGVSIAPDVKTWHFLNLPH